MSTVVTDIDLKTNHETLKLYRGERSKLNKILRKFKGKHWIGTAEPGRGRMLPKIKAIVESRLVQYDRSHGVYSRINGASEISQIVNPE